MLYTFHCSLDNSFIVQRAHTMISEMVIDIQGLQMISIISIYICSSFNVGLSLITFDTAVMFYSSSLRPTFTALVHGFSPC